MNLYRKPWSIRILAALQLITPVSDILLGAIRYKVSPWTFLMGVIQDHQWHQLVEIFALAPLAGLAILCVRWWSYPIFLGTLFWTGASNYIVWRDHPGTVSLGLLLTCYGLNILFVSYFLIPSVRKVYFNPRVRWWETKPRYSLMVAGSVRVKGKERSCTVVNVSEGGVSIETSARIVPGTPVSIRFSCLNREYLVGGEVIYQLKPATTPPKKLTYGIQFVFTRTTKEEVRSAVKAFELLGLERRPKHEDTLTSFKYWVRDSVQAGVEMITHDRSRAPSKRHEAMTS